MDQRKPSNTRSSRASSKTPARFNAAAELLCGIRTRAELLGPLPSEIAPVDELDGYEVQERLHGLLSHAGWGQVRGHKIGCTTQVMQRYMSIDSPCSGGIFDSTIHYRSGHWRIPAQATVGVECEIAVRLARDITSAVDLDLAALGQSVASCFAAIEIVEDRYVDYALLGTPILIADDFFGAGCVLGKEHAEFNPLDLDKVQATMDVNGKVTGTGSGSDVLGHPLNALSWLAKSKIGRGQTLHAGEFVLLGSVVQTQWVGRGDRVVIVNDLLGGAEVQFE